MSDVQTSAKVEGGKELDSTATTAAIWLAFVSDMTRIVTQLLPDFWHKPQVAENAINLIFPP